MTIVVSLLFHDGLQLLCWPFVVPNGHYKLLGGHALKDWVQLQTEPAHMDAISCLNSHKEQIWLSLVVEGK